jgi:hypothetical protein
MRLSTLQLRETSLLASKEHGLVALQLVLQFLYITRLNGPFKRRLAITRGV